MQQQQHYKLLEEFGKAFNNHNSELLMSMMHDDATFYTLAGSTVNGNKIVGTDKIKKTFESVWELMPDAHWNSINVFIIGEDMALSQWIFTGTNAQNNTRIEAQGCDIFTFKDGKIFIKNAFRKQLV